MRIRPNAKDPSYEDVAIPARLATFAVDFSGMAGFFKPNQDMANMISLKLARWRSKVPAYTPFIAPKISDPLAGVVVCALGGYLQAAE